MAVKSLIVASIFLMLIECATAKKCDRLTLVAGGHGKKVVDAVLTRLRAITLNPDSDASQNGFKYLRRVAWVESRFGDHRDTYRKDYHGGIWQVDKTGFLDTQDTASHPGLVAKHKRIKDAFGIINWATVTWQDLRRPLYSGIAAWLYTSNNAAAIPTTLDGQAEYWKMYYNTPSGNGTKQKFIDDVNALENPQ